MPDGGADPSAVYIWLADGDLLDACDGGSGAPVAPHVVEISLHGQQLYGQPSSPVTPGTYTFSPSSVMVTNATSLTYNQYSITSSGTEWEYEQYAGGGSVTLQSLDAHAASGSYTAGFDGGWVAYTASDFPDAGQLVGPLSGSFDAGFCKDWRP